MLLYVIFRHLSDKIDVVVRMPSYTDRAARKVPKVGIIVIYRKV